MNAPKRSGDLGQRQIEWCRKNIPHFARAADAVKVVRAEEEAHRLSLAGALQ